MPEITIKIGDVTITRPVPQAYLDHVAKVEAILAGTAQPQQTPCHEPKDFDDLCKDPAWEKEYQLIMGQVTLTSCQRSARLKRLLERWNAFSTK